MVDHLSESSWFYRVITLMFGFALVIIAAVLHNFPSSPINWFAPWNTRNLVDQSQYLPLLERVLTLLSICALILAVLIAVCLGFAASVISPPTCIERWQSRMTYLSERRRNFIRECLWSSLLITLLAGVAAFDWSML